MTELLSVRQASQHTGKSESTIKRMIREIADAPEHEDRGLIEPSHDDLVAKKKNGDPYHWKVSKELLDKRYPANERSHEPGRDTGHARGESTMNGPGQGQLIEILQDQLGVLETQLDRKDKQIDDLNDRLEEQHVLMQTLQKHFNLPVPEEKGAVVEAKTVTSVGVAEVVSESKPIEPTQNAKPKKRRSLKEILYSPIFQK